MKEYASLLIVTLQETGNESENRIWVMQHKIENEIAL